MAMLDSERQAQAQGRHRPSAIRGTGRRVGMDGTRRADISVGSRVQVVQKHDQRSGTLTEGTVNAILTKSATHPHGIKVRLTDGVIGRVKAILSERP
jgi:uncharacterized repeat protein (TIGR03833 family)